MRAAAAELAAAGVGSPRRDAEALLAHVLGREPADLSRALIMGEIVTQVEHDAYVRLLDLRASRVPLQHLTGVAHFRRLSLRVGPGVFVPRPETEVLVDLALRDLAQHDVAQRELAQGDLAQSDLSGVGEAPVVVDLCTGSGAIALSLAQEWPQAQVFAVELSADAHAWAAANVADSGLAVELRLGDATTAFEDLLGRVQIVVSNPPYIPPGSVPVDPEVRDHDPEVALYGLGEDGLQVPLAVAARAAQLLVPGGVLLMEHADVQGQDLVRRLGATGAWGHVADHQDLSGLPRVTRAVRA